MHNSESFQIQKNTVLLGNSIELIKNISSESTHLILSDIPYGIGAEDWDVLHTNTNSAYLGASPAQKKTGAIFKKRGKPINGWSEADKRIPIEYQEWCDTWASEWFRILKPGASAIVFAGRRFSHRCICSMENAGFNLKDMLAWMRTKAPHRAQRLSCVYERRGDINNVKKWDGWRVGNLQPTFEPILWFSKPYKMGGTIADNALQHGVGAYNQDSFIKNTGKAENVISSGFAKGESGYHPTQKPLSLMKTLIELTTQEGQLVVDPFCGSGSTLVAANELNREFIGFDLDPNYVETSLKRIANSSRVLF
ncbi:DNA-methyltransferase [Providencia manganoxydans]|uniref:DNA-methyltransferase n=1 Tax=Providencia manganoxydans TaxID=2923283 RepID=UPI0034E480C5